MITQPTASWIVEIVQTLDGIIRLYIVRGEGLNLVQIEWFMLCIWNLPLTTQIG